MSKLPTAAAPAPGFAEEMQNWVDLDSDEQVEADAMAAARWYLQKRVDLEREHHGRFIAIDAETGEFVIGDEELETEQLFVRTHGLRRGGIFRIGHF